MTQSLFRREAIEHHSAKIWGDVTLSVPVSLTIMTGFLATCIVLVGLFVATSSYARKEHVSGFLVPRLGVARVMPPRSGTIAVVHVVEGQFVAQGAPLLTVSVEQTSENGHGVDSGVLASMKQQRERLAEQIDLDRRKTIADQQRLTHEITSLTTEAQELQQEVKLQAERTKVAYDQMSAIVDLTKRGIISRNELKKRQDNYLSQQQAGLVLNRTIGEKHKDITSRRDELGQLPLAAAKQKSQAEALIADLDAKIKQIDGQRAYLVTAPKAGRISALQALAGQVADPKIPLMSIVPEGNALTAELFVPARAIGLVSTGQVVHVSYASFPYQQFGFAQGTVEAISQTLLKPNESNGPISFNTPVYRITVALSRQTIKAYGKEVALQADMQLDADILFDRRKLVAWIFGPLLSPWEHM